MVGTSLLHYEIVAQLGEGGMGEVYRARDKKLKRDVAIKVLPEVFAGEAERIARLEREAQLLASLSHPHIATIFGLEEATGIHFLVLELVEGKTLAAVLAGGALETIDALEICSQVAEALEAAHTKHVLHRDLKPSNVMITPEGGIKVLDFGLAKAFEHPGESADLAQAPTEGSTLSGAHVLIGTVPYMSPEQIRRQQLDKRTDIWAFGCVLFETISGRAAFAEKTISDTMAAILRQEPDWDLLPESTPPTAVALIHRCLQKDAHHRLHDIADARIELQEARGEVGGNGAPVAAGPAVATPRTRQLRFWQLFAAAALTIALVLGIRQVGWRGQPQPVRRIPMAIPPEIIPSVGYAPILDISPDGQSVVYTASQDGDTILYRQSLDALEPSKIAGTQAAYSPFFSPDGKWIAFFDWESRKLKKVPLAGGEPTVICDAKDFYGGVWGPNGTILLSAPYSGIYRVPDSGGSPVLLTRLDRGDGELGHDWPDFLPGGKQALFTIFRGGRYDDSSIAVVSFETGQVRSLLEGGYFPHYAPSGHLLFVQGGSLVAVPFDLETLEPQGDPIEVIGQMSTNSVVGYADFAFSDSGSLVYLSDELSLQDFALVSIDSEGTRKELAPERRPYASLRISPNGGQVAVGVADREFDIWTYDLERGGASRLTFDPSWDGYPVWTPDGRRIAFASERDGGIQLFVKSADGSGTAEPLVRSEYAKYPSSWLPDGSFLVYSEQQPESGSDIWILPVKDGGDPQVFLRTPFAEGSAMISPDGKWVAYQSNQTGQWEVYVRPFPEGKPKVKVSTEGGYSPRWSPDGRRLFYRRAGQFIAVEVKSEPTFSAGLPRPLFEGPYRGAYDVGKGSRPFVGVIEAAGEGSTARINLVLNWFEELERLASR
ncbi:MAG: protein kinase [Acidobacteriota bacterium]